MTLRDTCFQAHVLPEVFWISRWTWLKVAHDSSTSGKMPVPDTCSQHKRQS